MKKIISAILVVSILFCLAACGKSEVQQDTSPITMSVANGSNKSYFLEIKKNVKRDLNIDIELVYQYSSDTSNSLVNQFKYDDLSADIMATAAAVNNEYLENTCLDYQKETIITDNFTKSKLEEYTDEKGGLYQLPFTSKLIGVTYNKTLMEENGWEVPNNYSEMLELKQKCDEKGISFAVSGGCAAGHGFNWLFHLMGADWLSTLDGTDWFESFLKGETTVDKFADEAQYFKKYYENGLFGEFYSDDWDSGLYYREQRALFHYGLTNDFSTGIRLNEDGTIYGAEYDENNELVVSKSNKGDFVKVNDVWTVFDESNASHQELQRYDIPGAKIDEFATMPWLSEDGTNNRFTCYDNMFIMLNKKLGEENEKTKLENVIKVLEYMCTAESTSNFSSEYKDGYVAVNDFELTEDRIYYKYADKVSAGYIQPWYYILVDTNTLCDTGNAVNDYMAGDKGNGTTFDDIINIFAESVMANVNNKVTYIANVTETFTYKQLADMLAYVGATDAQAKLDEAGIDKEITVSLMPYTENTGDMAPWSVDYLGMTSTKLYAGDFEEVYMRTIFSSKANSAKVIEMTGAELNKIIENKLDHTNGCENYGTATDPYPYAVVTKNNITIEDGKTYYVCVNELSLNKDVYQSFLDNGKILKDSEGNLIQGNLEPALIEYFKTTKTIKPDNINWK